MKRWIVGICVAGVLLGACCTRRVSTEQVDYSKLVSEWKELAARYEKRTEVYRDSLLMVKGLMERSANVADSVSHLETSYALSDAAIKGGRLYHSIENRDSVPGRVRYVRVEVERHDTLRVEVRDTVYVEKVEKKETVRDRERFGEVFFYVSGWIGWLVFLGVGIWFLYKVKKGER